MKTFFYVTEFGLYILHVCKLINFSVPPETYNGRVDVTGLTSDELREKFEVTKPAYPAACYLLKVSTS